MTRWRTIRTALLATFAAAVALAWPPHPTWRVADGDGHLLGFTPDGGTVVCSREPEGGRVELVSHDAATGRVVAAVPLGHAAEPVQPNARVVLSPDGRRAVVSWHPTDAASPTDPVWELYDAVTGARLAAMRSGTARYLTAEFTPDGRRFGVVYDTAAASEPVRVARELFDATTGASVAKFAPTDREHPAVLAVRDDGAAAAVLWLPVGAAWPAMPGYRGEVVGLPAGDVRRRFTLPPAGTIRAARWQGDRLTLFALVAAPFAPGYRWRCDALGTAAGPIGPGVEQQASVTLGRDWTLDGTDYDPRLHIRSRPRADALPNRLRAWAAAWGGGDAVRQTGEDYRVRVIDPDTAAVRGEAAAWFDWQTRLSPDGRHLAALGERGLELWPTTPWPRWPAALAAAVAAGAAGWRGRRGPWGAGTQTGRPS